MSNVILFNLTTVLFGVASALYLGALYAKNEKIAGRGTPGSALSRPSSPPRHWACAGTSRTRWGSAASR